MYMPTFLSIVFRTLIIFMSFVLVLLILPHNALATQTYQEGDIILFDDFNDGNLNGWIIESGVWSVDNTQLFGKGTGKLQAGRISNDNKTWDNYRIDLDVKNENGVDEGIGFRRADANNNYELTLRHGTGAFNTPEIILAKIQNGSYFKLFSTRTIPLRNQTSYHVKLEVVEEHIQLWIDNILVLDIDDKGTSVKKGSLSLSYWTGDFGSAQIRFDNIKVTELSYQRYPVVFIPGISGSELKANQDIVWNYDNGHGEEFKHIYKKDETIWVNKDEAVKVGSDDYFDVLKLAQNGQTSIADITPTGNLTPFGYQSVEQFSQELGYKKNTNFFIYNYDWRKDVAENQNNLDTLIKNAINKTGYPKVNIVAHSMGGLIANHYISNESYSQKVNKFITLGTPYAGSVDALKTLLYGKPVGKSFFDFLTIGISGSEVKDVSQNFPSMYQLLPNTSYYRLYDNSTAEKPYPFYDERDIDKNNITKGLTYDQTKSLLIHQHLNEVLFPLAESLYHINSSNLGKNKYIVYHFIAGVGHPTLGQIKETWFIKWPFSMIDKQDELFINGDAVVPLLSALPSSDNFEKNKFFTYKVNQKHNELPNNNGAAMNIVKSILMEGDATNLPTTEKVLAGFQLTVDNGEILFQESDLPEVTLSNGGPSTQHAFIPHSSKPITATIKNSANEKTTIILRQYADNRVIKNELYKDIPNTTTAHVSIVLNQSESLNVNQSNTAILPTVVVTDTLAKDTTPPQSVITIKDEHTLVIDTSDDSSGVLETIYTINDEPIRFVYSSPITFSTPGVYKIKVSAMDKTGNSEYPQLVTITVPQPSLKNEINTTSQATAVTPSLSSTPPTSPSLSFQPTALIKWDGSSKERVLGTSQFIPLESLENIPHLVNAHHNILLRSLLITFLQIVSLFFPQFGLLEDILIIFIK